MTRSFEPMYVLREVWERSFGPTTRARSPSRRPARYDEAAAPPPHAVEPTIMMAKSPNRTPAATSHAFDDVPTAKYVRLGEDLEDLLTEPEVDDFDDEDQRDTEPGARVGRKRTPSV